MSTSSWSTTSGKAKPSYAELLRKAKEGKTDDSGGTKAATSSKMAASSVFNVSPRGLDRKTTWISNTQDSATIQAGSIAHPCEVDATSSEPSSARSTLPSRSHDRTIPPSAIQEQWPPSEQDLSKASVQSVQSPSPLTSPPLAEKSSNSLSVNIWELRKQQKAIADAPVHKIVASTHTNSGPLIGQEERAAVLRKPTPDPTPDVASSSSITAGPNAMNTELMASDTQRQRQSDSKAIPKVPCIGEARTTSSQTEQVTTKVLQHELSARSDAFERPEPDLSLASMRPLRHDRKSSGLEATNHTWLENIGMLNGGEPLPARTRHPMSRSGLSADQFKTEAASAAGSVPSESARGVMKTFEAVPKPQSSLSDLPIADSADTEIAMMDNELSSPGQKWAPVKRSSPRQRSSSGTWATLGCSASNSRGIAPDADPDTARVRGWNQEPTAAAESTQGTGPSSPRHRSTRQKESERGSAGRKKSTGGHSRDAWDDPPSETHSGDGPEPRHMTHWHVKTQTLTTEEPDPTGKTTRSAAPHDRERPLAAGRQPAHKPTASGDRVTSVSHSPSTSGNWSMQVAHSSENQSATTSPRRRTSDGGPSYSPSQKSDASYDNRVGYRSPSENWRGRSHSPATAMRGRGGGRGRGRGKGRTAGGEDRLARDVSVISLANNGGRNFHQTAPGSKKGPFPQDHQRTYTGPEYMYMTETPLENRYAELPLMSAAYSMPLPFDNYYPIPGPMPFIEPPSFPPHGIPQPESINGQVFNSFPSNHYPSTSLHGGPTLPRPFPEDMTSLHSQRVAPVPSLSAVDSVRAPSHESPVSLLVNQVAFYFSPQNLVSDVFLRQQMDLATGWVPLALIQSFKRMRTLSQEVDLYLESEPVKERLRHDPIVELDEQGKRLRKRHGWEEWVIQPEGPIGLLPPMIGAYDARSRMGGYHPQGSGQYLDPMNSVPDLATDRPSLFAQPPGYTHHHEHHHQQHYFASHLVQPPQIHPQVPAPAHSFPQHTFARHQLPQASTAESSQVSSFGGASNLNDHSPPDPSNQMPTPTMPTTTPPGITYGHLASSDSHLASLALQEANTQASLAVHLSPLDGAYSSGHHPAASFARPLPEHLQHLSYPLPEHAQHYIPHGPQHPHYYPYSVHPPLSGPASPLDFGSFDGSQRIASPSAPGQVAKGSRERDLIHQHYDPSMSRLIGPPLGLPQYPQYPMSVHPYHPQPLSVVSNSARPHAYGFHHDALQSAPHQTAPLHANTSTANATFSSSGGDTVLIDSSTGSATSAAGASGTASSVPHHQQDSPVIVNPRGEKKVSNGKSDAVVVSESYARDRASEPSGFEELPIKGSAAIDPVICENVDAQSEVSGTQPTTVPRRYHSGESKGGSEVSQAGSHENETTEDDDDDDVGLGVVAAEGLGGLVRRGCEKK